MSDEVQHILKYHNNENHAAPHSENEFFCGHKGFEAWHFTNAQHAILALEKSTCIPVCGDCLKAIKAIIDEELDEQLGGDDDN